MYTDMSPPAFQKSPPRPKCKNAILGALASPAPSPAPPPLPRLLDLLPGALPAPFLTPPLPFLPFGLLVVVPLVWPVVGDVVSSPAAVVGPGAFVLLVPVLLSSLVLLLVNELIGPRLSVGVAPRSLADRPFQVPGVAPAAV